MDIKKSLEIRRIGGWTLSIKVLSSSRKSCGAETGPARFFWRGFVRRRCDLSFLRCRRLIPDAALARFRHQEQAEDESDGGNGDRIDQRVAKTASGGESRRGDERD